MRKIYMVFFVFYSIVFYSQKQWSEKQIDSIQNTIATTNAQNVDKIEAVCTELYYQSKQINYKKGQIEALLRKIAFKINSRNYDDVEQYLDETKKLSNDIQDYFYLTKANAMEVSMLSHLQLHTKAKKKLDENFKLIPKIEDIGKRRFMETYYYARYINLYQNNKDSLQYFSNQRLKTALLLPDTEASKPIIIVSSAGYLTHYYFHAKKPKQIDYYLKVQEKYIDKIDNLFDLIHYHKRKAEYIFDYEKNSKDYLDRSLYHFKKAEKYAQQYKNPELLELLYPEIARIYEDKNEIDKQVYYLNKYTKLTDSIKKKNTTAVANIVYQDKQKSYV
ncbi:hypothetical protein G6R40_06315 [Chryseobacterium sp. POL2]|uniref:hypothetical protein n=1 Tax=Chryseobacterium sp. POL2 TaxID=2713414 RepID=UPI0013E153E7|nr:hypothetical protein [Chryseobacterium sp. POL2]QIG89317.1 hypothetical protein G6R40_06315 [Chryseobacterium sp. POL2]